MNADEKNDEFKSNAQVIDIDPEDEDDLAALKSVKAGGGRDIFADPKKVHASKTEMQDSAKAIFSSHKAPKSNKWGRGHQYYYILTLIEHTLKLQEIEARY